MAEYRIEPIRDDDGQGIIDIFNYYIENGFAAFPERKVPYEFSGMLAGMAGDLPAVVAKDKNERVLGFGMLRYHNPMPAFSHTGEVTYFLRPETTGKGIGSAILGHLEKEGAKKGIKCLLACIASPNEGSIRFHEKHGFTPCGRFSKVARKNGIFFDTVWMEKGI
jgi:L-amino acid N-acyltransferase YncA